LLLLLSWLNPFGFLSKLFLHLFFLSSRRILLLEFRFLACLMQLSKSRYQSPGP
jgi:hypothetical protein